MTIGRFDLYARVGFKVQFPPHVNFAMPLLPDSEFGFRLTAKVDENGRATVAGRECFIKGQPVEEPVLAEAVLKACSEKAVLRSHGVPGSEMPFDGVAFDYVEVKEG